MNVGGSFESIAALWLANKRHLITNIVTSATLWVLWKLGNCLCFQGMVWSSLKKVWDMLGRMLRRWLPMFKPEIQERLQSIIQQVELEASSVPRIRWWTASSESEQSIAQPFGGLLDALQLSSVGSATV